MSVLIWRWLLIYHVPLLIETTFQQGNFATTKSNKQVSWFGIRSHSGNRTDYTHRKCNILSELTWHLFLKFVYPPFICRNCYELFSRIKIIRLARASEPLISHWSLLPCLLFAWLCNFKHEQPSVEVLIEDQAYWHVTHNAIIVVAKFDVLYVHCICFVTFFYYAIYLIFFFID